MRNFTFLKSQKFLTFFIFSFMLLASATAGYSAGEFDGLLDDDCNRSPVVVPISTHFGCPGESIDPSNTGIPPIMAGELGCPTPNLRYEDHVVNTSNGCSENIEIHREWIGTYPPELGFSDWFRGTIVQLIMLSDNESPTLHNCPSDIVLNDVQCQQTVTWTAPTATDDCGLESVVSNIASGSTFSLGTTIVTYTATDSCGKTSTCSFSVTLNGSCCTAPPAINCPADYTGCPGDSVDPSNTGTPIVNVAADTGCGAYSLTHTDIISIGSCTGAQTITRIWIANFPSFPNVADTCTQTITLVDNTKPVFTTCPGDIIVNDAGCSIPVNWTLPTATDNCGTVTLTSNYSDGNTFYIGGPYEVIYTATDECGNSSTCSFNVTVNGTCCTAESTITCPEDYAACPNTSIEPSVTGTPTIIIDDSHDAISTDNSCGCDDPNQKKVIICHKAQGNNNYRTIEISCNALDTHMSHEDDYCGPCDEPGGSNDCAEPTITYIDQSTTVGCTTTISRTWMATNPNDSSSDTSCVQTITLSDNEKPVFTTCQSDIIINNATCNTTVNWNSPIATDNCSTPSLTSNYTNGSSFSIGGPYTVIYTATDECGNSATCSFDVTVNGSCCNTAPTITCPADYTGCPGESTDPAHTGSATSNAGESSCGTPIVSYVDQVTTGACANAVAITRTWTATDPNDSSLHTSCTQTITLVDNEKPVFTLCPSDLVINNAGCNTIVNWTNPTVTDNCGVASFSSNFANGSSFQVGGPYQIIYTAIDGCGNSATCSFNVTVNGSCCDILPNIHCPANYTGCPGQSTDPANTGYATTEIPADTGCNTPLLTYIDQVTNGTCTGSVTIVRTWTATDPNDASKKANCTQTITLEDTQVPVITNCPSDITLTSTTTPYTWTNPTISDNCEVTLTSSHPNNSTFPIGTTNVVLTATDNCGNAVSCSFNITVPTTGTGITLNCPTDITVDCNSTACWNPPTFSSECGGCNTGSPINGFMYMGSYNGNAYYCSLYPDTWQNAQSVCVANGGYLASINSSAENTYLASLLTIQSAYIGLSDYQAEGNFVWANGDPLSYSNWYPGQPNNYGSGQDYVEMLSNGKWNDQYTNSHLEYIMELPCGGLTQIAGPPSCSNFPAGTTTITYQATDGCGNIATCSFNVTSEGGLTMECPSDVVVSCPSNSNGAYVNWNVPQASSCCSSCSAAGGAGGGDINGFMYMGEFGGSHYYCSLQPDDWQSANNVCKQLGGTLAVVDNSAENSFLANILTIQSAYIGLSDYQSEGNFVWANGEKLSYSNWYPGQPNNYANNQDYVEMLSNGQWNDQYNYTELEYIMELPGCVAVHQTAGPTNGSFFPVGTTQVCYRASDPCQNAKTCCFNVTVNKANPTTNTCNSYGQNTSYLWINRVDFGDLWYISGNNGGYADFTDQCATISSGSCIPLKLSPGYAGSAYTVFWRVYIDYNQDGDYNDTNEFIAQGAGTQVLSGMIKIPYGIPTGETTMRVIMKYGAYPSGPCARYSYGETEDYCIQVTDTAPVNNDNNSRFNMTDDIKIIELAKYEKNVNVESREEPNVLPKLSVATSINAFPNPASSSLNIEIEEIGSVSNIVLYTIDGEVVKAIEAKDMQRKIDVSQMAEGIYLLKIRFEDGSASAQRIIIQH